VNGSFGAAPISTCRL